MTGERLALSPDLAAAYVTELSTDVRKVVVDPDSTLPDGVVVRPGGTVVKAGPLIAVLEPGAMWSATALDVAAMAQTSPPAIVNEPSPAVIEAAEAHLR